MVERLNRPGTVPANLNLIDSFRVEKSQGLDKGISSEAGIGPDDSVNRPLAAGRLKNRLDSSAERRSV